MRHISNKNSKKGFTLLETVISFGILTILLLAAYSLAAAGLNVYNMDTRAVQAQSSMRLVLTRIERDVRTLSGNNTYDLIQFTTNSTAKTKTLTINTSIVYQYDQAKGTITRTETSGGSTTSVVLAESILDFTVTKDSATQKSMSIQVSGSNVAQPVRSDITFRDVT